MSQISSIETTAADVASVVTGDDDENMVVSARHVINKFVWSKKQFLTKEEELAHDGKISKEVKKQMHCTLSKTNWKTLWMDQKIKFGKNEEVTGLAELVRKCLGRKRNNKQEDIRKLMISKFIPCSKHPMK